MQDMLNRLRVSTKVVIPIVFILVIGNIVTNYITSHQMNAMAKQSAKESLQMLTNSLFITLRNAMNTGDPETIKNAENQSRTSIKGLTSLIVAKSRKTIEAYSPETPFTTNTEVLKTFDTKKEQVLDFYKNDSHYLRVIRPMIATQECLSCHYNQQIGDVIGVIDLTFSLDKADKTIDDTVWFIVSISIGIIILAIVVVLIVSKKATEPLDKLKSELGEFFAFLNHERDSIEPFKVHSMDEIGEMVVVLNENIAKTKEAVLEDAKAIKEVGIVCQKASLGNLKVNIKAKAANPEINNLVEILNQLLKSTCHNINRVLDVLNCYAHDAYTCKIESKGNTTGEIKELFEQVDTLGETLTKLSGQNLKNGKALQQTSNIFSKNILHLNQSSQEQVKALGQTAAALNEITTHIQHTTENSKDMAKYAQDVTNSSNTGEKLALKTQEAMNDINVKIGAINDAIEVIDQISFQTNILSLNAAVEAATAGEAGKGFAVVAQEVRNLASRSAQAASEIKDLVSTATEHAKDGTNISAQMIEGYNKLHDDISSTTKLIDSVATDSRKQLEKIEQINQDLTTIDNDARQNAKIAQETNIVAQQAHDIAQKIVNDASQKKFAGKEQVKVRKNIIDTKYDGPERRKIEKELKSQKR